MTTTDTQTPARSGRPEDFATLFPELYRSAFTAAHSELRSRTAAQEVTYATLARAHSRWSRIGDSPASWVSTAARTQALDVLQRQPPGREVLLDDEAELLPGEIPAPAPTGLAAVTRRGTWLRRRRRAGWAAAGASVVAVAGLAVGLGNSLPPSSREPIVVPVTVPAVADYSAISPTPWSERNVRLGRISAGRSEQGSVRLTFEPHPYTRENGLGLVIGLDPAGPARQVVIDPEASLLTRGPGTRGQAARDRVAATPQALILMLNRSMPGGEAYAWVRFGPDGKISALRQE